MKDDFNKTVWTIRGVSEETRRLFHAAVALDGEQIGRLADRVLKGVRSRNGQNRTLSLAEPP